MLLKVSDGANGWVVFDKVSQVHFLSGNHKVKTVEELGTLMGDQAISCLRSEVLNDSDPVIVGEVEFRKEGSAKRAFFTGICFLCNDSGDTLDRFRVPNG